MLDRCDSDGRVRGNLVYHGAGTGRWAGAGIQIQNYPRGILSGFEIELVHELLEQQNPEAMNVLLAAPMLCLSSSLRSFIRAKPGHRLLVCDFASIEARVVAWIAGQTDLVELFRNDGDVYKDMASKIYDVPVANVTKTQRQMGKLSALGCGFGTGPTRILGGMQKLSSLRLGLSFVRSRLSALRSMTDYGEPVHAGSDTRRCRFHPGVF